MRARREVRRENFILMGAIDEVVYDLLMCMGTWQPSIHFLARVLGVASFSAPVSP